MIPTAETILTAFRTGSSLPVLAMTNHGTKCVVKWNGTGEGIAANVCDWIALQCARHIGIPVPAPHLISVTPDLVRTDADPEINELIMRSIGINLGIEYFEQTTPFSPSAPVSKSLKQLIYCFDVLMLNMDRTDVNPNMFFINGELYCLDFAAAMSLKMFFEQSSFSNDTFLPLLRRHPFYLPENEITIPDMTFRRDTIRSIVESIPNEWLTHGRSTREQMTDDIDSLFTLAQVTIKQRLQQIDTIALETSEERRLRVEANLHAFEKVVKRYQ